MEKGKEKKIAAGTAIAALILYFLLRGRAPSPGTAILEGMVIDDETAAPIQGIQVACNGYGDETGANGRYSIADITPGTYTVIFTDPLAHYETKVI